MRLDLTGCCRGPAGVRRIVRGTQPGRSPARGSSCARGVRASAPPRGWRTASPPRSVISPLRVSPLANRPRRARRQRHGHFVAQSEPGLGVQRFVAVPHHVRDVRSRRRGYVL